MTSESTPEGREVLIMDDAEFSAFVDEQVRLGTGYDGATAFVRAFRAGELDDADPAVSELLVVLGLADTTG